MLKPRNIFRIISSAFFALCFTFSSAWADYTITMNPNGGSAINTNGHSNTFYICDGYIYPDAACEEREIEVNEYIQQIYDPTGTFPLYVLPTRAGYNFAGYYSAQEGGTQYIYDTGQIRNQLIGAASRATGNFTIYANWTPTTYTITYNLNGGTNPANAPTSYNVTSSTITLPTPTKSGYNFAGWCDDSNLTSNCGTNRTVPTGSTGDKIYYAKWGQGYTVTLDGNGADGGSYVRAVYACGSDGVALNPSCASSSIMTTDHNPIPTLPSRAGYSFAGYFTEKTGGYRLTDSKGFITTIGINIAKTITANSVAYAQWTPNTYTVTYKAGEGGVGADVTQSVTYMQKFRTKPANTFSKPNATFNNWTANVGGTLLADEEYDYTVTKDIELTATWNNTITIKWYGVATAGSGFTAVSGQANTYTSTVPYGGDIVTPVAAVASSAGQTFLGWKFQK